MIDFNRPLCITAGGGKHRPVHYVGPATPIPGAVTHHVVRLQDSEGTWGDPITIDENGRPLNAGNHGELGSALRFGNLPHLDRAFWPWDKHRGVYGRGLISQFMCRDEYPRADAYLEFVTEDKKLKEVIVHEQ